MNIQFTDWRGTPIEVGSRVVYPTGSGSSIDITEGEVIAIIPTDNHLTRRADQMDESMRKHGPDIDKIRVMKTYERMGYKLKVKRTNTPGGFSSWQDTDRPSTLNSVERVTVIQ